MVPWPIRRHWAILALTLVCLTHSIPATASDVGRRFLPERQVFADRATGTLLTALTTAATRDGKFYQTHPQWTADGIFVLFFSYGRSSDGQPQIFAVNEITGEIIQLTDGPAVYVTDGSVGTSPRNRISSIICVL